MSRAQRTSSLVLSLALVATALAAAGPAYAAPARDAAPAAVVTPAALAKSSVSGWPTTAVTMKLGGELSARAVVKPAAVRTIAVQARKGTTGTVATKSTVKTTSTGVATVRFVPASTGTWFVRLSVKATTTAAGVVTAWRKVTVSGLAGASKVSTPTVSPSTVLRGTAQKVRTVVSPKGVRAVEFYAKAPGTSTFVLRGRATSSSTGVAALTWNAPKAGTWTYRVFVRASLTLKGATSATRTAVVTDLPAPVTALAAATASGAPSVSLSWTNPSAYLASVVVRRTSQSVAAPTTTSAGIGVPLASAKAASASDATVTVGGAYRYTVFTLDSLGRYGPGVSVLVTTSPSAVIGLAASTGSGAPVVSLTWTNPSVSFASVVVRRTLQSQAVPTTVSGGVGVPLASATATTASDSTVAAGGAYRYTVFTLDSLGHNGPGVSVLVTTAPEAVTGLVATPAVQQVSLSWTNPTANLDHIVVRRASELSPATTPSDGVGVPLATTTATSVTDTGLTELTGYSYTVFAFDALNHYTVGVAAATTTPDTPPAPVTNASVDTSSSPTEATVSWTNPPTDVFKIWLLRSLASDPAPTSPFEGTPVTLPSETATSGTDTGLTPGTEYRWTLIVVNDYGSPSTTVDVLGTTMAPALTWTGASVADPQQGSLKAISCTPGTTFCAAGDQFGDVLEFNGSTWTDPTRVPGESNGILAISCSSPGFCRASTADGNVLARAVDGTWAVQAHLSNTGIPALGCAPVAGPVAFCLMADYNGSVRYTTDGTTWSAATSLPPSTSIRAVDCPTTTFCSLVGAGGKTFTFTGLSSGVPQIAADTAVTTAEVRSVDCTSASFCAYVTGDGKAWVTSAVTSTSLNATNDIQDVTCVSSSLCIAVDYAGYIVTWNGSSWATPVRPAPQAKYVSVSCLDATHCFALDGGSAGWEIRWNGSTWGSLNAIDRYSGTTRLSCTSSTFCMVGDQTGRITTYDGTTWSAPVRVSYPYTVTSLECATPTMCMLGDVQGDVYRYDGSTWTQEYFGIDGQIIRSISCPTTTFCVFVTSGGAFSTWDGSAWTPSSASGHSDLWKISCVSSTYCLGVVSNGSTDVFDGVSWIDPVVPAASILTTECVSAVWCMGLTTANQWSLWNGVSWSAAADAAPSNGPAWLSCTSTTFCTGVGTYPLKSVTWDGATWAESAQTFPDTPPQDMSCTTNRWCMVLDQSGNVYTGTR